MNATLRRAGAALLVLVAAAFGLTLCAHRASAPDRNLVTVRKDAFEVRVDAVGVLDAARGFHVASAIRGDRGKIVQIAEDGAAVSPGDVLVRFDPTPFEADAQRLAGETRSREAVVDYARQSLEVEKSQAEKTVGQAEFDLRAASQELARFQAYIADLAALGKKGVEIANEMAQARRKEEQVFARVQKAETDVARVKREAVHRMAQAAAELQKAQGELDTARSSLAQAKAELEKSVVRAPTAGFVVLHEIFQGNAKRRPRAGDAIWQGQPILYLPDLSSMIVKTRVREEDLHKVRPGLAATVRVDAYPDATFAGKVESIGALAMEAPGANAAGKYFQLTLALDKGDARLRPGMTARVEVVSERVKDALVIPVPALFFEGSKSVAYVFDGRSLAVRAVAVGRRSDDLLEVTSGLAEGEQVSLVRP